MKIDFANLSRQYARYKEEIDTAMARVLEHGRFIMGPEISELEAGLCAFTGAKHAVACSSGTDALLLAMMALDIGPGDEVITTPFTFIATAETIALLGAKPVFVDIDEATYNIDASKIEAAITEKTKAVMLVSLYGQPADLDAVRSVTDRYRFSLIVDGAQSFGATYKGKAEVHFCDVYTTSFFPAKPLGCFGDGGAVLTNDDTLAEKMRMLRVHGQNKRYHHKYIGLGARLDTLQAAVLNVKLKHYPGDLKKRQAVAAAYTEMMQSAALMLPIVENDRTSTWAQYSVRVESRDDWQATLKEAGVPTAVHYPMPLHLQECFAYLGYKRGEFPVAERVSETIMSLPMNPDLSNDEIEYIVSKVREFAKQIETEK
jgi:UDP-2-acetamido-2-deoxy-ribo-hexuluronate aminotransferase